MMQSSDDTIILVRRGRAPVVLETVTQERRIAAYALAGLQPNEIAATLAGLSYGRLSGVKVERGM